MAETEHETSSDNVELEITDLYPGRARRRSRPLRLTTRQRAVGAVLTTLLFLLVVSALLDSSAEVRALLARILPSPRATAIPGSLSFYLQGNPDWGHFLIDGRAPSHLPVPVRDRPLILTPGQHTITWQVAPFRPRTCRLTVLNVTTVSGPCLASTGISAHFVPNVKAMVLSFFASLNDLLFWTRESLVQRIQQALDSYGTGELLHPGERYAVSEQQIAASPSLCHLVTHLALCYAIARQSLWASLRIQLDSSTSPDDPCVVTDQCSFNRQDCRALCEDPTVVYGDRPMAGWSVAATVSLSWSYTTLSAQPVAHDQPISAVRGTRGYQMVSLHITRTGQDWHISPFSQNLSAGYDDPLCSQAAQDTGELTSMSSGNQNMFVQDLLPVHNRAAEGCLVVLTTSPGTVLNPATPAPAPDTHVVAYCLVRFGVVLAVNRAAHQEWPFLPLADSFERSLANAALAAQAGGSRGKVHLPTGAVAGRKSHRSPQPGQPVRAVPPFVGYLSRPRPARRLFLAAGPPPAEAQCPAESVPGAA